MLVGLSSLMDSRERQEQLLREAEQVRLVNEAKQPSEPSNLRKQLGQSLVRLGQRLLSSEPELA